MRHTNRELGLKLERMGRLRRPDKIGKICWLFSYCVMAMASKNPKMVFLELAKVAADLTRKIEWVGSGGERSMIDLVINDDLFQVEIISTGEVVKGKRFLSRLDWNGHYYIEIYPEYYPYIKYIRKWCLEQLRDMTNSIENEDRGFNMHGKVKRVVGI